MFSNYRPGFYAAFIRQAFHDEQSRSAQPDDLVDLSNKQEADDHSGQGEHVSAHTGWYFFSLY